MADLRERACVTPAVSRDVDWLAPRLRAADRREVEAAFGRPPEEILRTGYRNAKRCWAVRANGRPIAMFGVGRRPQPRVGAPWLLASADLEAFHGQLRREGPYWVDLLMAGHDVLTNFVAADNQVAVRWLTWLGFRLLALHRGFGTHGEDFWQFAAFRSGMGVSRNPPRRGLGEHRFEEGARGVSAAAPVSRAD